MAQRRRDREQWRRLVDGWARSGLTQQGYCDRHGISHASLRRWRQIFRQGCETATAGHVAAAKPLRLVPVELVGGGATEAKPLTLLLADGIRIEIAADFDAPTLRRLLGVLRAAA